MSETITLSQIYDNNSQAVAAVKDLEVSGVAPSRISVIARNGVYEMTSTSSGAAIGAVAGGGAGLLTGLGALAIPGIGPVVAAGWLAATALGAAAGATAGGLVGALIDSGISDDDAHFYAESVRRGGTLVTVRCDASGHDKISAIMQARNPVNVAARQRLYRDEGWTSFDDHASSGYPIDREPPRV